ncbi:TIGR02206 family membrane protein [Tumebacillus permanentifrigoris]|uniref:Putative integral membrane protein (TIGR02206 family) n=1 Tax=Tumebacillus permanentifrigoris TaxID=378543 RepID=A0A316DEW5_9BACL|nr:TIGR02206 family membrane protein [Tumebacillus permanentifrigoris]PWK14507.1 putative integral membrane protein (TIGR02206 family) [Tumebacillus permanentifrigoris]
MNPYFSIHGLDHPFHLFNWQHNLAMFLLLVAVLIVYTLRQKLREPLPNRWFRYVIAAVLALSEIALESWQAAQGDWSIDFSLPLQLCSISLLLSIVMMLNKSYRLFEFLSLAGLGGALQAIITPDLGNYAFPHFRTFEFFIGHGAIVLACFFMVFVEGYRPTLGSVWRSLAALNVLAVLIYGLDLLIGGNYMFLVHKPSNASILDLMGPWPWYILSLEGLALAMHLLLFAPFFLLKSYSKNPSRY